MLAQEEREALVRKQVTRLADEFQGHVSVEIVAEQVQESLVSLEDARIKDFIPIFVERIARERLRALVRSKPRTP
jgi:hypothetical protein